MEKNEKTKKEKKKHAGSGKKQKKNMWGKLHYFSYAFGNMDQLVFPKNSIFFVKNYFFCMFWIVLIY